MTERYTRCFRVRHYELAASGHVHPVNLVRYMQEAAIEASTALGFSPEWYESNGFGWVVRRLSVRYFTPVTYGDEVAILTWVSAMRGVRSIREYDLTRSADGMRVARCRAEWVYVDSRTGQPTRFPDSWAAAVSTVGSAEELGIRLPNAGPTEKAYRYRSRRRVQFQELDTVQHVNHAVYLAWTGQARHDALRAAGYPSERTRQEGWDLWQTGQEVQYCAGALENEEVETVSWLSEISEAGVTWTHEVYQANSRKLLARDVAVTAFTNRDCQPIPPRQRVIEDLLRGPSSEPVE
jgi:acyl-CoA thioester hydrolase